jgi:hypothetical protein
VAVLSVDVVMKIQFYRFLNESVHISRLAGKDLCLFELDLVVIVDSTFGHSRFIRVPVTDMPSVFFYSLLNRTARLTTDLGAFAGNTINSWYLQSHIVLHRSQAVEDLLWRVN